MTAGTSSSASRLVERLSGAIAHRTSRRGFLVRSALGATALSVAPTTFALRPTSAYAAVCGCSGQACDCGSLCCDGYTEMCCTITGINACPAGTALGGWWKADGAVWCGGGPRYYMDCNVVPGNNPCSCGCTGGNCDNRKTCCTQFRYGQCHQEIPVMGAIMCRVVTCTPPWLLDSTCTTATAIDQTTLSHDRPCLSSPSGVIDAVVRVDQTHLRVVGWVVEGETNAPIDVHVYVDGVLAAAVTANRPRPDVAKVYPSYGPNHGFDVTFPIQVGAGTVCVYAINTGLPGVNPAIGCRAIEHNPFGVIDQIVRTDPTHLRIRGWAIDPDTWGSINLHFYLDNVFVGSAIADDSRPDVGNAYPAYGANHGFDVVLPIELEHGVLCVYAINSGPGSANPPLACAPINHLPFGMVDEVVRVDPSHLRVRGWAIDPDVTGPIRVHLYVDGGFIASVTADQSRPDVGNAFPNYGGGHGYDVTIPVPVGGSTLCVFGINDGPGGVNPPLACAGINHLPFGVVDQVSRVDTGRVRVRGWAIDPDAQGSIDVHIYVDGTFVRAVPADDPRPDVANAYPGYGSPHGFNVVIPAPLSADALCVYAINQGPGSVNPPLACHDVPGLLG